MSKSNNAAIVQSVQSAILSHFDTIIAECNASKAHAKTAHKFAVERKNYENLQFIAAFVDKLALKDASLFDFMLHVEQTNKRIAIYAMQKVTRLLRAIAVHNYRIEGIVDKYTRAILANIARGENALSNYDARASLCSDLKVSDATRYTVRLHCADSTASTQRSTSSIALHALKLARYDREAKLLTIDKSLENYKHLKRLLECFRSHDDIKRALAEETAS